MEFELGPNTSIAAAIGLFVLSMVFKWAFESLPGRLERKRKEREQEQTKADEAEQAKTDAERKWMGSTDKRLDRIDDKIENLRTAIDDIRNEQSRSRDSGHELRNKITLIYMALDRAGLLPKDPNQGAD